MRPPKKARSSYASGPLMQSAPVTLVNRPTASVTHDRTTPAGSVVVV